MAITWVLVADGTRARIFSAVSPVAPLEEIDDLAHPENRLHERQLTSDLPGRSTDDVGAGRHAMNDQVSAKKQESIDFARRIASELDNGLNQHKYERLIIVAAPSLLGLLRKQLNVTTSKHIVLELDKNIAHLNLNEIRSYLPERLPA